MEIKVTEKRAYDVIVVGGGVAGAAAALCVRGGHTVNTLPYDALRRELERAGVLFDIRGK